MDSVGAEDYPVPSLMDCTDAEIVTGLAAKRCYLSFQPGLNPNVTKVRQDWDAYFENILKVGHGSVLEHCSWTFAIEGVSRVFTSELNRHRAGCAISEGSMRYIRFDDMPFWLPTSLQPGAENNLLRKCVQSDEELEDKKAATRDMLKYVFAMTEKRYAELCALWGIAEINDFAAKKQLTSIFRRIVPMGVATGGVWTINGRALRHILTMRAAPEAEEEICYVFSRIASMMLAEQPRIFGDFEQTPDGFFAPKYRKV